MTFAPSLVNKALLTACAAAALAGCYRDPAPKAKPGAVVERVNYRAVSRLDCPERQGDLTRIGAGADGRTCDYRAKDGTEVQLRLLDVPGQPAAALEPLETELKALMPDDLGRQDAASDDLDPPTVGVATGEDDAHIRLPGLTIDADDSGAKIRVAGVRIDADDGGADVTVKGRGVGEDTPDHVNISAGDRGAVIRTEDRGPGYRSTLILAGDKAQPFHVVGYDARGPEDGPLVVGVVKSPRRQHGDAFKDVQRLVRRQFN